MPFVIGFGHAIMAIYLPLKATWKEMQTPKEIGYGPSLGSDFWAILISDKLLI